MASFKMEGGAEQRLVVSDGVQSSLDAMLVTAGEIRHWIDDGGTFALFLFRAPYYCDDAKGQYSYFSETLRERNAPVRVAFNTDSRPFVVFAFLTSERALDQVKARLLDGLSTEDRTWALEIRKPTPLRLLEVQWVPDRKSQGLLQRVTTLDISGYPAGVKLCLLSPDPTGKGGIPVEFEVKLRPEASKLPPKTREQLLQPGAFDAAVHVVEIPRGKPPGPAKAMKVRYEPEEGMLRMTIPQVPKDGRLRMWYAVLTPSTTLAPPPYETDVTAWSTWQDDTPKTQDRILNLQSLVDEVCRGRAQARLLSSSAMACYRLN